MPSLALAKNFSILGWTPSGSAWNASFGVAIALAVSLGFHA
jgi:hypothetical protein